MKRFRIIVLPKAEEQLGEIRSWWHRNRLEHPDLVEEEMDEALRTLSGFPEAGPEHPSKYFRGVRRILLPRSRCYLYYRVDSDARSVRILAVWSTTRRRGPPLR
jgi:plasmid stabilization system protein ParE